MWSSAVVVVEPVWQGLLAVVVCSVDESVSPFAGHRLVEALDFAVRARPVGLGGEVLDVVVSEQRAERAVSGVREGVVGHQPLGGDSVRGVENERSLEERRDGRCAFVVVELGVGEPRVVVDNRVGKVVADSGLWAHPVAAARVITRHAMAGVQEPARSG